MIAEINTTEKVVSQWNWIYKVGGTTALIALFTSLLDIIHGFGGTEVVTYGSRSAIEWFSVYQQSPWEGLYSLGILNIIYMAAMLPVHVALFGAHRRSQVVQSALVVVVFLLAMSIYFSTNAAIPLLVGFNQVSGNQGSGVSYSTNGGLAFTDTGRNLCRSPGP